MYGETIKTIVVQKNKRLTKVKKRRKTKNKPSKITAIDDMREGVRYMCGTSRRG